MYNNILYYPIRNNTFRIKEVKRYSVTYNTYFPNTEMIPPFDQVLNIKKHRYRVI